MIVGHVFSAALCRGLIEAAASGTTRPSCTSFSAALCRGLIEAGSGAAGQAGCATGFPRLYAAASLKQVQVRTVHGEAVPVFRGFMPRPH